MEEILADPMPTVVTHVGRFFGILALTIGLSLVALILYAMLFGG
jgi:hypothetical protein